MSKITVNKYYYYTLHILVIILSHWLVFKLGFNHGYNDGFTYYEKMETMYYYKSGFDDGLEAAENDETINYALQKSIEMYNKSLKNNE